MTLPNLDAIDVDSVITAPNTTQLTTKSIEGTGVFDILMQTVKLHLGDEFDAGRIDGSEYATVYLGALTAVLQQSISFLAQQQGEIKNTAEVGLIRQKTVTELANTDNDIPEGLGFNGSPVIEGLVKAKLDLDALQADLVASKIDTDKAEKAFIGQKIISELAQTDSSITQAKLAGHGYNDGDTIQGVLEGAIAQSMAQAELTEQKVATELAQTSTTKPADLGLDPSTSIDGLVKSQVDKAIAEQILLYQKTNTELAQTADTVSTTTPALNTSSTVSGAISKQKDLYTAQTNGYARDAEQKLAKMMLETWSVDATVGDATANDINKLDDASLGSVITKAKQGIGV